MTGAQQPGALFSRRSFMRLTGAAAAGMGAWAVAGCGTGKTIGTPGGGALTLGRGGDSVTLDPVHSSERESGKVCMQIFDTLLAFRPGTTDLAPSLALAVPEPELGGRQYTFKLRDGVTFHDGTPFDADAVVVNFDRWRNTADPLHQGGGGQGSGFALYRAQFGGFDDKSLIEHVEAVDPHTVRFHLKQPSAPFLTNLAIYPFGIASPTALKKDVSTFWQQPVGTGPFKFTSWAHGSSITLEKNAGWWGSKDSPQVDKLVFQVIPDESSRVAALLGGNVSFADGLNPDDVATLSKQQGVKPVLAPPLNIGYLAMNCRKKPFTDPRVRLAVVHAINMAEIVKTFFGDTGELASNPMPSTVPHFAKDIKPYEYDPQQAASLLQQAGYGGGFQVNLWYFPIPRPYLPNGKEVAQAMAKDLAKVGITANLVTRDLATYVEATGRGEHDMCMFGWNGDTGDPSEFMNVPLNSASATPANAKNVAFYRNPEMDSLLGQAVSTVDADTQAGLYHQAQELFHRDAPWAPIAYVKPVVGLRDNVQGFTASPVGLRLAGVKVA